MSHSNVRKLIFLFLTVFSIKAIFPHSIVLNERDVVQEKHKIFVWAPYAFYTDSLGLAGGLAAGSSGYFQEQLGLYGAVMVSTNASYGLFIQEQKFQIPHTERLFLNSKIYLSRYTEYREYSGINPAFPKELAGSNESLRDNFVQSKGWDNQIEMNFSYILPIGIGAERPVNEYILDHGVLKEGSTCTGFWNPFESGRTFFEVIPFYHWQDFRKEDRFVDYDTNGLALALKYDNTDFYLNPSKGSSQRLEVRRDFGAFDSSDSWTAIEFDFNKYFSLGESPLFRQRVIALDFWTAFSPTWKDTASLPRHSTPDYYGARLGGLYRMRGYEDRRFHDKAAVYYSAEYRVIPRWQPLNSVKWLRPFEIDWWQFVVFAEAGRVAPEWSISELNKDLKFDAGFSFRIMAFSSVCRLDLAFSEEEVSVIALIGHPF